MKGYLLLGEFSVEILKLFSGSFFFFFFLRIFDTVLDTVLIGFIITSSLHCSMVYKILDARDINICFH